MFGWGQRRWVSHKSFNCSERSSEKLHFPVSINPMVCVNFSYLIQICICPKLGKVKKSNTVVTGLRTVFLWVHPWLERGGERERFKLCTQLFVSRCVLKRAVECNAVMCEFSRVKTETDTFKKPYLHLSTEKWMSQRKHPSFAPTTVVFVVLSFIIYAVKKPPHLRTALSGRIFSRYCEILPVPEREQ